MYVALPPLSPPRLLAPWQVFPLVMMMPGAVQGAVLVAIVFLLTVLMPITSDMWSDVTRDANPVGFFLVLGPCGCVFSFWAALRGRRCCWVGVVLVVGLCVCIFGLGGGASESWLPRRLLAGGGFMRLRAWVCGFFVGVAAFVSAGCRWCGGHLPCPMLGPRRLLLGRGVC